MTGVLPPELGLLTFLHEFRTTGTNLSCSGVIEPFTVTTNASCSDPQRCTTPQVIGAEEARQRHICSAEQQLPCFLKFSEFFVPRGDQSNMRCKAILRKDPEEASADCAASNPQSLGDQASLLPDTAADQHNQQWLVDPAYFQYQACDCLQVSLEVE